MIIRTLTLATIGLLAAQAAIAQSVTPPVGAAGVNAAEADGTTALHWAVRADDTSRVMQLLQAGASATASNRYGVTPLSLAALNGNVPVMRALLAAGADPNTALAEGETVLMTAARAGNTEAVKLLLANGADVNARERWQEQTALMWAAGENHAAVVTALIEAGAETGAISRLLPGMPARPRGGDVAQQGVHSNFPKGGLTALLYAVRQNASAAVEALAAGGADLDQADPDGFTPLIIATLNGHYDLAKLLVEKGAGLEVADKGGRTPLYAAVDMNTYEYSYNRPTPRPSGEMTAADLTRFLLARGANPNAQLTARVIPAKYETAGNPNLTAGSTPFLKAASTADVTLMRMLLDAGADPFLTNATHTNALMVAAGLNWRNPGSLGSEADAIEAIRICLERGLDINSFNDLGQTVLHASTMRGRGSSGENNDGPNTAESENLVRFLVQNGARLDLKDKSGRTPLDLAAFMKNATVAAVLRELSGVSTGRLAQQ